MPDFLFDGPNRIISEPAGAGNTTFEVERDLYSAWKRWVLTGEGAKYPAAFSVEGGNPIGATGLFTGKTVLLVNGWKIQAAAHDHQLFLIGNLFSDDGITSVATAGFSTSINVTASVSAQGIELSSGGGLTTDERAMLLALWKLSGADVSHPLFVPAGTGTISVDDIEIEVTGDCDTGHTLTRQP